MITRLNGKTVYLGTDLKKFNEIRDQLEAEHIKYKYYTKNRMGQIAGVARGTVRGNTGSVGVRSEEMYEYEILVHKDDYERLLHI